MDLQGLAPLFEAPFIWLLICLIVGAIAFAAAGEISDRRKNK